MKTVQKLVNFRGKSFTLTLHLHEQYDFVVKVTDELDNEVKGLWKIGTYGQIKPGPLEFDSRPGGDYNMYTTSSWCNGRKKNGRKYLVEILTNKL